MSSPLSESRGEIYDELKAIYSDGFVWAMVGVTFTIGVLSNMAIGTTVLMALMIPYLSMEKHR